jgi:hypothetical protein
MRRSFILFLFLAVSAAAFGQTRTPPTDAAARWNVAWEAEEAASPFGPSVLARQAVLAELRARPDESAESHARRSFAAALAVERSLRLGYTLQESRARLRRSLRMADSAGAGNGERMAAKLEKMERASAKRGGSSPGTAKGIAKGAGGR